jgi:hypothetical protein
MGEFLAQSLATMLLVFTCAYALRRTSSAFVATIALVGFLYALMWPYAYGKLMKTTAFEYGLVLFKSPPVEVAPRMDRGEEAGHAPQPAVTRTEHAIVLSRGSGGANFLVVKESDCPGDGKTRRAAVKLWAVPLSEIVAIREIYREDVITWRVLSERPCPDAPPPF